MAYYRLRGCKCPSERKRCTCGARWSYTIDIGIDPVSGKRRQVTKGGFGTKKEAVDAAAHVTVDYAQGTYVAPTGTTFEDFCDTWMRLYRTGRKKSTLNQREYQIGVLKRYFAKLPIQSINRQKYQETMHEFANELQYSTAVGVHGTARMIFRKALEFEVIKIDPTEFAKVPRKTETEEIPKYMEKSQLKQFLETTYTHGLDQDYLVFLTLAYTGLRVGELIALRWEDLNFTENTISINHTLYNPYDHSEQYELGSPKTKSSKRVIDVDPQIMDTLKDHQTKQKSIKMLNRKTYHDAGFVFAREDDYHGYPLKRGTIAKRLARLLIFCDIGHPLTPHSFRHTHTSLLAEAGVALEAIMKRLGHKDDRLTRVVYLHVTKTVQREASEKFSRHMHDVVIM